MDELTVFEAGMRNEEGRYCQFILSSNQREVEYYIEMMKKAKPEGMTIIYLEKTYRLVSTTPHIVVR